MLSPALVQMHTYATDVAGRRSERMEPPGSWPSDGAEEAAECTEPSAPSPNGDRYRSTSGVTYPTPKPRSDAL